MPNRTDILDGTKADQLRDNDIFDFTRESDETSTPFRTVTYLQLVADVATRLGMGGQVQTRQFSNQFSNQFA